MADGWARRRLSSRPLWLVVGWLKQGFNLVKIEPLFHFNKVKTKLSFHFTVVNEKASPNGKWIIIWKYNGISSLNSGGILNRKK